MKTLINLVDIKNKRVLSSINKNQDIGSIKSIATSRGMYMCYEKVDDNSINIVTGTIGANNEDSVSQILKFLSQEV